MHQGKAPMGLVRHVSAPEAALTEPWVCRKAYWHFYQRLWERYGIILEQGEHERISAMIRDGQAVLVRRSGAMGSELDGSLYAVRFREGGPWVYVAWCIDHLITAYPPDGYRPSAKMVKSVNTYRAEAERKRKQIYRHGRRQNHRLKKEWS